MITPESLAYQDDSRYPFVIASYGSLVGVFDQVEGLAADYHIDYDYHHLHLIVIVPEPTTLAALGLAGLMLLRRRSRR